MRPYLAVLKDAFREAASSFLLWLVLILLVLVLIGLAGFGLKQTLASKLSRSDLVNEQQLADKLIAEGEGVARTPGKRIWEALPQKARDDLKRTADPSQNIPVRPLVLQGLLLGAFNDLLERRDLYEAEAWKKAGLGEEARAYAEKDSATLSAEELRRFNRLLIDAAFPFLVASAGERQMQLVYAWKELMTIPGQSARDYVGGFMVFGLRVFVGLGGLIIAILVTSATIPQMFEPGAIDLLLSKPVSRVALFLTRFFGGCTFVLLIASVLVTGVWLIAGVRLGMWFPGLFLCIPVFVFLFVVYYSVSALTGVIWKNSIVSVILTLLFMGICSAVQNVVFFTDLLGFDQIRLAKIVTAGDSLIVSERNGTTYQWNSQGRWDETFQKRDATIADATTNFPYAGPVYDPVNHRLAALESKQGFGQFGGTGRLVLARGQDGWQPIETISSPFSVVELFVDPRGELITVGAQGIHKLVGDPTFRPPPPLKLFGGLVDFSKGPQPKQPEAARWDSIGPEIRFIGPMSASMHREGRIAVFSRGKVTLLSREADGRYSVSVERELKTPESGFIVMAGPTIAVVVSNGQVHILDSATLNTRFEAKSFTDQKPRQLALSDDGRWLFVVTHERALWSFDAQKGQVVTVPVPDPTDVTAVSTSGESLFAADFYRRVTKYQLGTWTRQQEYDPQMTFGERFYVYGILGMHKYMPRPDEMSDSLSGYLVTEKRSATEANDDDLKATRVSSDPWKPLRSNVIFVAVLLSLASLYVWSKDF